jgi:adenosylcobinamide-GDP ribazoletransferase
MIAILGAFQFLTLLPPMIKRPFTDQELGKTVGFYPFTGLVLGGMLLGTNYGFSLIAPDPVRAGLVLTLWVVSTGALHLDGFLDTCDGLFGGSTAEKRLVIMRDERIGAFGFAGGFLLLLLKFAALAALPEFSTALLLVPVLSRWGMSTALIFFPYGRKHGMGRVIKDNSGWQQAVIATLITLLAAWFSAAWFGMIIFALSLILTAGCAFFALKKIPGLTGDIYGAINEILEMFLLLGFILGGSW